MNDVHILGSTVLYTARIGRPVVNASGGYPAGDRISRGGLPCVATLDQWASFAESYPPGLCGYEVAAEGVECVHLFGPYESVHAGAMKLPDITNPLFKRS
jgi:hypothetical protein